MTPIPLTDMAAGDSYKGQDGGLYGGGSNEPPRAHREAVNAAASRIRPLAPDGTAADSGVIGLLAVGFSHTSDEFKEFVQLWQGDSDRSPAVRCVNGAQSHMATPAWATAKAPWRVLASRLEESEVTAEQVQAVWIKTAPAKPARMGEFPAHAEQTRQALQGLVILLGRQFPNLRIAYLSSRSYAGYASSPLSPEPYAYEGAFAMRWVIQAQIAGDPALNWDPAKGPREAPLLLWGPYLWADGMAGRKHDGLVWARDDFEADGTHLTPGGSRKVARLLLDFLKRDPSATPWFLRPELRERPSG